VFFRLIWPLLIIVALIFALVVTAAGESTRTELTYLDEISSQSAELSRSGASLRDLMPRIREVDRDEFTTVFDNVETDLAVAQAFVAEEPPVESLIPVWALYRQAVRAWEDGVATLSVSLLHAADDPQDSSVVNIVGDGLADLRAGDNIFDDLRSDLEREEIPEPATPLVDVDLYPGEGGLNTLAASYVAAARASTNGLGLRPGLRVSQVVSDPAWQLNVEAQAVIPATEQVTFSAVITNVGNVESTPETLDMLITGEDREPLRVQAEVPILAPDGQATVSFDPVAIAPDLLHQVVMELVINGIDTDLTDNRIAIQFTVNSP
jgi:hypothetical protein